MAPIPKRTSVFLSHGLVFTRRLLDQLGQQQTWANIARPQHLSTAADLSNIFEPQGINLSTVRMSAFDDLGFQNTVVKRVVSDNHDIGDEICDLDKDNTQHRKDVLGKLYKNMSFFSDNLMIVEENCFFSPIRALMKLPLGDFIAARMLLYLASVFIQHPGLEILYVDDTLLEGTAPLYEFCTKLDDTLLEPLRRIWTASNNCENYDWVFSDHCVTVLGRCGIPRNSEDYKLKIAQALSHQELEDLGPEREHFFYYSHPQNDFEGSTLFTGPIPRWDCDEEDIEGLGWESIGHGSSIRGQVVVEVVDKEGDPADDHNIPALRRSKQFCLDARQIAEATLGSKRHQLLNGILIRHRIPAEIHLLILGYLEYREPFPYLRKLDIAAAYVPFPQVGEPCLECEDSEEHSVPKRTCPQRSLYIWNLPLRRFHVFHKDNFRSWTLCAHSGICPGHHDHDGWEVGRDPEFTLYLDAHAAQGNDEFVSLDQVGLGPVEKIRLDSRLEDSDRWGRLFFGNGVYRDSMEDLLMIGGLGGLKHSMLHGKVLTKAWKRKPRD
ncbi:hypothetical protein NW762_004124 [Fusarium torreyae]|uniref:Uncharacterized protein n=1 Tax=Fusarium torreyae TaxID=1237075 RepID=A0A9W8S5F3_9HYPO|nr:hypothetical protein NW762_004124 [Fusarium torreyae]